MLFCVFPDSFLIRTCLGILPSNPSPPILSDTHTHTTECVYFSSFYFSGHLSNQPASFFASFFGSQNLVLSLFMLVCLFFTPFLLLFLKMWENFTLAPMEMLCVWSFCSVLYVFDIFGTSRWLDCMAWLLYGLHFGWIIYRRCGRDHSHVPD